MTLRTVTTGFLVALALDAALIAGVWLATG
jgi:hypothetical protein